MGIGVLEGPAAGAHVGPARRPIAQLLEHLQRPQPVERLPIGFRDLLAADLQQRVQRQRRVPHRREAGLAIGLVLLDDEQLLDRRRARPARSDRPWDSRAASNISTELTMAGKIAPSPSSPLSRSVTKSTALSIARLRGRLRENKARRSAASDRSRRTARPKGTSDARPSASAAPSSGGVDEQLVDAGCFRGLRAAASRLISTTQRHEHGARPIGDLLEMERKPSRQQHDLDRHHRHARATGQCHRAPADRA